MKALKSILYSLLQTLVHLEIRDSIPELWFAAKGICRALTAFRIEDRLRAGFRSEICEKCVFYDQHWKTCGTPGEVQEAITDGDGIYFPPTKIGCWCYLPLANRDPEKDCWARAKGLDHVGWPDALRPQKDL